MILNAIYMLYIFYVGTTENRRIIFEQYTHIIYFSSTEYSFLVIIYNCINSNGNDKCDFSLKKKT